MTLIAGHPTAFWIGIVFEMTSMRNLTVHRGLPSWIVGSEEARLRAGLRPPPKLHVRLSRMQLSRRHMTRDVG